MKQATDQDGKSKTASAADAEHYPEQHEVLDGHAEGHSHDEIAERAHEIWMRRGCPHGSAEEDWFEAEQELRSRRASDSTRRVNDPSGTVQR